MYVLFAIFIANFFSLPFLHQPNRAGKSLGLRNQEKFAIQIAKIFGCVTASQVKQLVLMQAANNQLRVRTVEALDAIAAGQQQRTVLEDTNKIYISKCRVMTKIQVLLTI